MKIHTIIPTYRRPQLLKQCISSLQAIPGSRRGETVIIWQEGLASWEEVSFPWDKFIVLLLDPGIPGPRRKIGAEHLICQGIAKEDDCLLFLDDDTELLKDPWNQHCSVLLTRVAEPKTGCIHLMLRPGTSWTKIKLGWTGGGILVQVGKYRRFGGYGDDYLDDVELFLRSYLAGFQNWRCGLVYSKNHGSPAGGLSAYFGLKSRKNLHLRLSRLDERYPGKIERTTKHWLGFRLC